MNRLVSRQLFFAVILSITTCLWAAPAKGERTIHAIFVGDIEALDIQEAVQHDINNMNRELEQIVRQTGMNVKKVLFAGPNARIDKLIDYVYELPVMSHDLLFFYFSGHGYRTIDDGDRCWPNLYFAGERHGLNFETLIDLFRQKQARLTIAMADCCNNVIDKNIAPPVKKGLFAANNIASGYRKLFSQSSGFIAIVSCEVGETSIAMSDGSLYTATFLETLHKMLRMPLVNVNWENLLSESGYQTSVRAFSLNDEQTPFFVIED